MNKLSSWAKTRKGFKHQLVVALVDEGFSFDQADQIISTMFDSMKQALQRGESVALPFGTLRVVDNKPERQAWRFGKVVTMYKRHRRVVLECNED